MDGANNANFVNRPSNSASHIGNTTKFFNRLLYVYNFAHTDCYSLDEIHSTICVRLIFHEFFVRSDSFTHTAFTYECFSCKFFSNRISYSFTSRRLQKSNTKNCSYNFLCLDHFVELDFEAICQCK